MTDAERVLQVLIHDVRTPIGVAQGYVRLLQEQRLGTADEQERALARTMDALGRIARLCNDASEFLAIDGSPTNARAAATALAANVEARVSAWEFRVERTDIDPAARVCVGADADRLAEAVGLLLATVRQGADAPPPALRIDTTVSELRFVAAGNGHPPKVNDAPVTAFDAWKNRGLAVPLACRTVDRASGRVSCAGPALVIAFPLEKSPA
jgi:light-regulated signal transduction histidine kinase (bacteriophytochrome)